MVRKGIAAAALAIVTYLPICAAQQAGPDAYWRFDGDAAATLRDGTRAGTALHGPEFAAGIDGQALTIGSPDGKSDRSVSYIVDDLLDHRSGSVSFWVKPLDWHGGDAPFHIMLRAMAGQTHFLVYKYFNSDRLLFLVGLPEKWTSVRTSVADWAPGAWHHVAATWSEDEIALWVDGRRRAAERLRYPTPPFANLEPLSVGPGGWTFGTGGTSLLDELRLYGHVIDRTEIEAQYLQHAGPAAICHNAGLIVTGAANATADGTLGEDEYAFTGTGFQRLDSTLSPIQSRYFLGYDAEALHIAIQSPLAEAPGAAADAQRDADLSGVDRVELYLAPGETADPLYHLVLAPDGRRTDARGGDTTWDCHGLIADHRVADGTWIAEASIPFAALGLSTPPDGQDWRINLGRVFPAFEGVTGVAPAVGTLADWSNFVTLRFRQTAPGIRILSLVEPATGIYQPRVEARAGGPLEVAGTLFSSTGRDYGDRTVSFTLCREGRATPFAPPETTVTGRMSYVLELSEGAGDAAEPLYRGSFVYDPQAPLSVLFAYTLHATRELAVAAHTRLEGEVRARFFRLDGTVALERRRPAPPGDHYLNLRFALDLEALTPGDYVLRIDHLAPDGTATGDFEQEYRVPDVSSAAYQPYEDPDAAVVPAPWTPLQTDASTATMLGRTYGFGGGFLVSSLQSEGQEMLAAPMRLVLDGKQLSPAAEPTVRKLSDAEVRAEWEKATDLGPIQVDSRLTVHFDGYCEVSMTLRPPADGPIEIASLSLEVPFRSEVISLVRDSFVSYGSKSGAIGDYWSQTLADRPMLWVGTEQIGFNWIADDLSGWHYRQEQKNVEIVREDAQAVLRLNLIDTPLRVDAPRTIDFGFVLTPSRPLDPRLRRSRTDREWQMWAQPWNYFNYLDADEMDMAQLEAAGERHDETFLYMSHNFVSPFCPEWAWWEEQWRHIGRPYGEFTGDPNLPPALRNRSCYAEGCLGSDGFRNFHIHQIVELLRRAPVSPKARHYYFDFSYGIGCENEQHGCSPWVDINGKAHKRLLNRETREVALATYRAIKRSDPNAIISAHLGYQRNMPVQHFTEVLAVGEGTEPEIATQGSYYDILTPEVFRATYLPQTWGMKIVFINQLLRAPYIFRPQQYADYTLDDPQTRRALLHLLGYLMVHDVDGWWAYLSKYRSAIDTLWATQDALGWDEHVVFHPYWGNDGAVSLTAPDSDRVLASAYTREGKLLLAVLNDTDQAQDVSLTLELDRLGVAAGMHGADVWEPEKTYVLSSRWQDVIPPRGFRLVLYAE